MGDKVHETAWQTGQEAAFDGLQSAINAYPVDFEPADDWAGGWLEGERLRWMHQVRSRRLH